MKTSSRESPDGDALTRFTTRFPDSGGKAMTISPGLGRLHRSQYAPSGPGDRSPYAQRITNTMDPREKKGSMDFPSTTARSARNIFTPRARRVAARRAPPPEGCRRRLRPDERSEKSLALVFTARPTIILRASFVDKWNAMEMDSIISRQRISPRRKSVSPFKPLLEAKRAASPRHAPKPRAIKPAVEPEEGKERLAPSRKSLKGAALAALTLGALLLSLGAFGGLSARPRLPVRIDLHEDASAQDILTGLVSPELHDGTEGDGGVNMPPLPVTLAVRTYVVRPGDALLSIANRHNISLDTLISMNGITDARRIYAGARLRVPNISGIVHTVSKGDSVGALASRYGVSPTAILDANDLGSSTIRPGQALFIPGARMSPTELKRALGELIRWPIRGPISSYFGYRPNPFTGIRQFHNAIDIVAATGTPIRAAMDGRVADVGYNSIYGNYVILTHADNYQTLYAHMSRVSTKRGMSVSQGSVLGAVGSTGYSTGPHLHFSVFRRGSAIDPLKMLK